MENVYFLWRMVQQNCQEETTNSKNPLQGGSKPYRVRVSVENFKAHRKGLNRQNQKMTFVYRHHIEPRVQLYAPKEVTFPIPLITRSTFSDLDIAQEKELKIIGMSMETDICQIRGQVSRNIERDTSKRMCVVWRETDKN